MKSKHLIISAVIVILLLPTLGYGSNIIRQVQIKIIDEQTNLPVSNVIVYRLIRTSYLDRHIAFIPKIDPVNFKDKSIEEYRTGKDGIVNISAQKFSLDLYESLISESFYINIDLVDEYVGSETRAESFFRYFNIHDMINLEKFYNPKTSYRGFVIYNTIGKDHDFSSNTTKRRIFDIQWNGKRLKDQPESITVRLKHW